MHSLFSGSDMSVFLAGTGGSDAAGFFGYDTNTFVHATVTYDGSQIKVYKDGQLEDTVNASIGQLDPDEWAIGSDDLLNGENKFHNGKIDDVRIYDSALSSTQINQIYQNTQP